MERAQGTYDKASKLASEDAISSMPDIVITNIMNRLPIRDAVRTSILARNWRLKWTLLTHLVFDTEFSESLVTLGPEDIPYYNTRSISRLFLALKGPVTKFVLYIDYDQILDVEDFNHWFLFFSRKGIKKLHLEYDDTMPPTLPTYLFSCLELTHLKLGNCYFCPPPTFGGFPNLLSLDLRAIMFGRVKCGEFITLFPLLEILEIAGGNSNYSISKINLDDIAKLKNLKKLTLSLRELENKAITTSSIFQFLGFLPKLEELFLDFLLCKVVVEAVTSKCPPTAFPRLNTLTLSGVDFGSGSMLSCVYGMIWGSPNLQQLRIVISDCVGSDEFDVLSTSLFSSDSGSNTKGQLQLQDVVILQFRGSENEVRLVKYLLTCSPFLKRIGIYSRPFLVSDEKLRVSMKLLKLHRASPVAEVDFY